MPELPEVETVRRGLATATPGWLIVGGEVLLDRAVAAPKPEAFLAGLQGCCLVSWKRRGKYLLGELQRAQRPAGWLGAHLRMTGQFLWVDPATPVHQHTRIRLRLRSNAIERELRFVDQRTFGHLWWVSPDRPIEQVITGLAKLGPEPFDPAFSIDYFAERLRKRHKTIKATLLDQDLVAGLGNIYADESLFLAGIWPETRAADLSMEQVGKLHQQIRQVLEASLAAGGTTFSDFVNLEGVNGNYGGEAWVYNRKGQPCRVCGTAIERLRIAGRSSHVCPQCQPRSPQA